MAIYSARVRHEKGKLRQEITAGRHQLAADEPIELGGEDTAPSPYELLAASLGACTAITLRMYAQRKGWKLENADVRVSLEHGAESTKLTRQIALIGELPADERKRLLEIANRCPVHRVLTGKIEITTELVEKFEG